MALVSGITTPKVAVKSSDQLATTNSINSNSDNTTATLETVPTCARPVENPETEDKEAESFQALFDGFSPGATAAVLEEVNWEAGWLNNDTEVNPAGDNLEANPEYASGDLQFHLTEDEQWFFANLTQA